MLRETASLSMGVAETHAAGLLRYGTIVWSTHIGWLRPASVLYHLNIYTIIPYHRKCLTERNIINILNTSTLISAQHRSSVAPSNLISAPNPVCHSEGLKGAVTLTVRTELLRLVLERQHQGLAY
jgi:hypothetical protein